MITDADLAWLGAILDLKGYVVRKSNKTRATPQLVLMVESAQIRVIEKLCHLTGSSVEGNPNKERTQKDWMSHGCTEHCPDAHIHHEGGRIPPTARWTATGVAAAIVLHNVIPHMVTDHGLEDAMREVMENLALRGPGSGAVKAAIRRLAELGWELPPLIAERFKAEDEALRAAGCTEIAPPPSTVPAG